MTTTTLATHHAVSADGTRIAYERSGSGPALVLVDGALCHRGMGPARPLAEALTGFTVYAYDRRGRGGSDQTPAPDPQREIEDLAAVIGAAGGEADVFGQSSGAVLAVRAAAQGIGVRRLALYEAPFVVDDTREPVPADIVEQLGSLIARKKNGAAVKLFMHQVGVPRAMVTVMSLTPVWSRLKPLASTLPNDFRLFEGAQRGGPLPAHLWAGADMPALVMDGGKSRVAMRNAQEALAKTLPHAEYRTLPGQTHMLKAAAVGPVLEEFLS